SLPKEMAAASISAPFPASARVTLAPMRAACEPIWPKRKLDRTYISDFTLFLRRLDLHKLPAEAPLDAEIAMGDRVVQGRRDLHDFAVLLVHGQIATHAAIRTDRGCLLLPRLVPRAGLAHIVFTPEHQRPG